MKKIVIVSSLCLATASFASFAYAADDHTAHGKKAEKSAKPSKVDEAFTQFDKNKDGFVTLDEIPAGHALLDHFNMSDKNRDGKLNKKEFGIALKML